MHLPSRRRVVVSTWHSFLDLINRCNKAIAWIGPGKLAAVLITAWILYQATRPVVVIENFEFDSQLKPHLLPEDSFAIQVQQQIRDVYSSASVCYDRVLITGSSNCSVHGDSQASFRLTTEVSATDFHLPAVGLSYTTLLNFIRHLIGNEPMTVRGVIAFQDGIVGLDDDIPTTEFSKRKIMTQITFNEPGHPKKQVAIRDQQVGFAEFHSTEQLAERAAIAIVKETDDLVYAAYAEKDHAAESLQLLESLPPLSKWKRFSALFPWTTERRRLAFLHGHIADELSTFHENPARAEAEFKESFRLRPDATIANNFGYFLYEQKRYDDALKWYQEALSMVKGNRDAQSLTLSNIGVAESDQQHFEKAIAAFRQAVTVEPDDKENAEPYYALGVSLAHVKRYSEAEQPLRKYVALAPNSSQGVYYLAMVVNALDRHEEAIEMLRKAVGTKAENWQTDLALATTLEDNGGSDADVEGAYRKSLDQDRYNLDLYINFARFLIKHHRKGEAIDLLKYGMEKMSANAQPLQDILNELITPNKSATP